MLSKKHKVSAVALVLGFAALGHANAADQFPTKPIRIIVPFLAGGSTDAAARLFARKMGEYLDQSVIVENRVGADGTIGARAVKNSSADGYTLLATSNAFSIVPALKTNPGYVPMDDFRGIGPMVTAPFFIDVAANQPYKTIHEFIEAAKADPEKILYAIPGIGSPNHIAIETLFQKTGVQNVTSVSYSGTAAAIIDVAAGRIPFYASDYVSTAPHAKTGKIRILAVTSEKRLPVLPDVPTLLEQNIDVAYTYWLGLLVPAKTPDHHVQRLSDALQFAMSSKELQEHYRNEGAELAFIKPADFDRLITKEVSDAAKLLSDLKIEKR
ncbi:tripartite tricarboxylate transporter substrate binding protein [Candidimonas sp. SYP-B2681]|uniref:Bug family tripartite tricarboxylate transporter substrate binding protein n=1 Tax=Candidimonas sp. SYP-B2681 TaxID=2497686 RepID=UPI000F885E92|nr:tripartite tricarboxylate transporter substrate binding protein [Candidimonas sp. SYP-B2681]RTZ45479.1 tripartite tricarboxylate transporter substrate binding protein [Candidimonas sp. SYP-B2681]